MELAPMIDLAAYCVCKIWGRCPQSASRIFATLAARGGIEPLLVGIGPNHPMPALTWRSQSPTAQNQGPSNPLPAFGMTQAPRDAECRQGSGFELVEVSVGHVRPSQATGNGRAQDKSVRFHAGNNLTMLVKGTEHFPDGGKDLLARF